MQRKEATVDDTATTERTVGSYFAAWTGRDTATVRDLLADDFRFSAMGMRVEGRDAFLASAAFPADAQTTLVAQVCQGAEAFQMYDSTRGTTSVRIVEHLTVAGGRIAASEVVTDAGAFADFLGPR
jgi:hypothetical protein